MDLHKELADRSIEAHPGDHDLELRARLARHLFDADPSAQSAGFLF